MTVESEENASVSNPVERLVMCAFAGMYQRVEATQTVNKVVAILIAFEDGDDEFSIKAKAERYVSKHDELKISTKGMNLVAWQYSVEDKHT